MINMKYHMINIMYYNISFGGIVFGSHFIVFLVTNYTLETNENIA